MASLPIHTVTVRGSDQRQIHSLQLGREATQRALAWPLQVMFRAPYEYAELDINSQGEVVKHRVKWQDCTTPYQQNRKRYYQYKLDNPKELQPVWSQWASFNSDGTAAVYNSASAAKAHKKGRPAGYALYCLILYMHTAIGRMSCITDDDAFIVMIGGEEMQLLNDGLSELHMPDGEGT